MSYLKSDFIEYGPVENGERLLQKIDGKFYAASVAEPSKTADRRTTVLSKIAAALNCKEYATAAIYFAQLSRSLVDEEQNAKSNNYVSGATKKLNRQYNPNEARDNKGRWTDSAHPNAAMLGPAGPIDPMCMIHKKRCNASCYDTLPTGDFGFRFFNCVNACMDAVRCLGRA